MLGAGRVSVVGRDVGAGLSCLFRLVVFGGYYLVAFLLGSRIMAAAPIVAAVVAIVWAVVRARLDGDLPVDPALHTARIALGFPAPPARSRGGLSIEQPTTSPR